MMTRVHMIRMAAALGLVVCGTVPAQAQKVSLLLDWAWIPYHTVFLIAQDRGFYKEAGLDVTIEQGRGSATTTVVVGQGTFDMGHVNITNAAQAIAKGVPLKSVAVYQHRTAASFIGIKGKVNLKDAASLKTLKIGSTPGGSDALSLALFSKLNNMPQSQLNVVGLDGAAKRAALLSGSVDVVSGDSHAYSAIVRGAGQQPEMLLLGDLGVPLLGFGFIANETFIKNQGASIKKFLAASKKGEQCVDYFMGLMDLSQKPEDPNWGRQTLDEWKALVATLESVNEIQPGKTADAFFTNDFVP
jgi:NitT/TauT family transport system substrate-binding protein